MSRGKDAKDVDWSEVASTFEDVEDEPVNNKMNETIIIYHVKCITNNSTKLKVAEKPEPIKISVDEVTKKARKTSKNKIKSGNGSVDKNSKFFE